MSDEHAGDAASVALKLFPNARVEDRFRSLPADLYTNLPPEQVGVDPSFVHLNRDALPLMGASADADENVLLPFLSGQAPAEGVERYAAVYAGHQFGHFVPQLGDGRAVTVLSGRDADGAPFELQLKGAGRTPYSRFGDGRAVMRSTLREYLCSEHMHALGIPTTRALSVVATREGVERETIEPGAILSRLAPSHIRFGHFEYLAHRERHADTKALVEHVIEHYRPELAEAEDPVLALFEDVTKRTAELIALWQSVGFTHGVMNTDNMSILGLTIDYGPYGFLDDYQHMFVCNHTDQQGRYAFGRQPSVALWNLKALAVALAGVADVNTLVPMLSGFGGQFDYHWQKTMATKLGLDGVTQPDVERILGLLHILDIGKMDYTRTFRHLGQLARGVPAKDAFGEDWPEAEHVSDALTEWIKGWILRRAEGATCLTGEEMDRVNPRYILRNWVAEKAIRAVEDEGDLEMLDNIFRVMTTPFDDQPGWEELTASPPEELRGIPLSCSS